MIKVLADAKKGIVYINQIKIYGFIDDRRCESCEQVIVYYDKYDAYFCPECNEWLESTCSDESCSYCGQRPAEPLAR